MLPNFLVVGAARCGTTYLDRLLRQHPEVYLPPERKELNFFIYKPDELRQHVVRYRGYFDQVNGQPAVGEISPSTMLFAHAAPNIAHQLGEVRLIFLLRNPVDRAYSDYHLQLSKGYEYLTFPDALDREAERVQVDKYAKLHFSYTGRGYYMCQIEPFLALFPQENMHFIISERFYTDTAGELERLCRFLGIDPAFSFDLERLHYHAGVPRFNPLYRALVRLRVRGAKKRGFHRPARLAGKITERMPRVNKPYPPMPVEVRQELASRFGATNEALAAYLNKDLSLWQ